MKQRVLDVVYRIPFKLEMLDMQKSLANLVLSLIGHCSKLSFKRRNGVFCDLFWPHLHDAKTSTAPKHQPLSFQICYHSLLLQGPSSFPSQIIGADTRKVTVYIARRHISVLI